MDCTDHRSRSRLNILLATSILATVAAGSAMAQGAPPSTGTDAAAATNTALGQVVVTATRVQTDVQRTPISMDVVGAADIKRQGIQDVASLVATSPSLSINQAAGVIIAIRGVAARDTSDLGDPAIVVSNDGFYNDRNQALLAPQYDLARIEVLKGPQGTLVGRNATGGAINFITVKPSADPGGYVTIDVGNYHKLNTEGAINLPLSDKLWARFSARSEDYAGYRVCGQYGRCDDYTKSSFRGQLTFKPTDNLSLHLLAERSKESSHGPAYTNTPFIPDATGHVVHEPPNIGTLSDIVDVNVQVPTYINAIDDAYHWDATWSLPWATVTYLGGWENIIYGNESNGSTKQGPNQPWVPAVNGGFSTPHVTNHELRLANANPDDRFTYQAGVYYFNNNGKANTYQASYTAPRVIKSATVSAAINLNSVSVFGQAGYKLTDDLKLTAGARYNDDKKSLLDYANPLTSLTQRYNSEEDHKTTYHAGLDWQATPANLLYAKVDTGYKAGGFTVFGSYGPELVTTYEGGSKNRFFDNRLQLNASVYLSNFTNQQVSVLAPIPNCPSPCTNFQIQTLNAGSTRNWGVEEDATLITDVGRFNLAVSYLNNRFTNFITDVRQTNVLVNGAWTTQVNHLNLTGNQERLSPPWTVVAGYQLTRPAFGGDVTGTFEARYQDHLFLSFYDRPTEARPSTMIVNLNLAYAPAKSNWQFEAYVRNLTNDVFNYIANENDSGFFYSQALSPPRTIGFTTTYKW